MRIISLFGSSPVEIHAHGSVGFTLSPVVKGDDVVVVTVRLAPGGRIGRHPAVGRQVLAVLEGEGIVSGDDAVEQVLRPGQAAVWEPGEAHETRTVTGLTALVIEGTMEPLDEDQPSKGAIPPAPRTAV